MSLLTSTMEKPREKAIKQHSEKTDICKHHKDHFNADQHLTNTKTLTIKDGNGEGPYSTFQVWYTMS